MPGTFVIFSKFSFKRPNREQKSYFMKIQNSVVSYPSAIVNRTKQSNNCEGIGQPRDRGARQGEPPAHSPLHPQQLHGKIPHQEKMNNIENTNLDIKTRLTLPITMQTEYQKCYAARKLINV